MRKVTAGVLFVIVLASSLPWEGLALSALDIHPGPASVGIVEAPGPSNGSFPSSSPVEDGCGFLCPICPTPVLSTNGLPADFSLDLPVGEETVPLKPQDPHTSKVRSRVFHPPRIR